MEKIDYSKEIYDKYCNSEDRILQVFLKDGSMLEGIFVGYFHGDIDAGEPYILKWHFIPESEIKKYHIELSAETKQEFGRIIKQKDIKEVRFKESK
jgi:hypothetical protein